MYSFHNIIFGFYKLYSCIMKKHVKKLWFSLPFPLWFEPKEVSLVQVWSSKHDAFPERN